MAKITNGKQLHKAVVYTKILPKGYCIPNTTINPTEIAIHNTGNFETKAKNYYICLERYNKENPNWLASYHFVVDDKEIYQLVDTSKKAYHVGSGNSKSIGIEICMFKDANKQKIAEDNAIALVKELMGIHNIPLSKVKMHNDYTGKHCPQVIIERDGNLNKFKKRIENWGKSETNNVSSKIPNGEVQRKAIVTATSLNVRSGRGTNYPVIGKLKKGDKVDLYYNMNDWCSMNSKFKDANGKAVNNYININYVELI